MLQIVKQTHEERVAMYMRCKKRELAEMLANRDVLEDAQRYEPIPHQEPGSTTWTPPWPIVTTTRYTPTT